jgi:hypothetical protein
MGTLPGWGLKKKKKKKKEKKKKINRYRNLNNCKVVALCSSGNEED